MVGSDDEPEPAEDDASPVPLTVPVARARHLRDPLMCCALGFGSGLSRVAPGTMGTIVGVALALALIWGLPPVGYAAVVALAALGGLGLCEYAARRLQVHDDPAIVWDEMAGYLVAMLGLPLEMGWVIAAFLLFRLLDIAKPWPINVLDRRLPGGLGIMTDDLLAGLVACAILHAVRLGLG
jgi:phosphatidylglycerophosphatase A